MRGHALRWRSGLGLVALMAVGLLLPSTAMAIPAEITVQGFLKTQAGLGADGTYALTMSLYDADTAGNTLWTETQVGVVVSNGLFNATLGADDVNNPLMLATFRDNAQVWVGIKVEAGPGVSTPEDELPRTPLTTVGYAFVAMHAETAATALNVTCGSACISESELDFNVVTDSELAAALAAIPQIDSVDGLSGGTITSGVTISGNLAATVLTQNGNTVCDNSGNCGVNLGSLGCGVGQTVVYDGSDWICTDAGSGAFPTDPCNGPNQAIQYDGSDWVCIDTRATGLSAGAANGYELTDNWGYVFDGIQRAPKTWAEAKADCEAQGGRLPTITELYRNNASATGTGNIGTPNDSSYLWTLIANYNTALHRVAVRLNNGGVTYYAETTTQSYRCVWPDRTSSAFDGDYCYGPPGSECKSHGNWWNVDKIDRPPVHFTAAANECAFYNASLVDDRIFQELAQAGWENPTNAWHWLVDYKWVNGADSVALGRFSLNPQLTWAYTDNGSPEGLNTGSYSGSTSNRNFRCVGKRDASEGNSASNPPCTGGCFTASNGRTTLTADSTDRSPTSLNNAIAQCALIGGHVPTDEDFQQLVRAGWPNGSNSWTHLSDPVYWSGSPNYGNAIARWSGTGTERYNIDNATFSVTDPNSSRPYRCVWFQTYEAQGSPTVCNADENQMWDGSDFSCVAQVVGNANGNAFPGGVPLDDAFGNAWDVFERAAATFEDASNTCAAIGARLPTATEIWRVRFGNDTGVTAIGTAASSAYLWTLNPDHIVTASSRVTMRVSDGGRTIVADTNTSTFRCIWPATKGDAFGGQSCHGPAAAPCHQVGHLRMDAVDRAPISHPSAAWECAFYGGRLPKAGELARLVHDSGPNGSNSWLWLSDSLYWHTGNRGIAIARWTGTGDATWQYRGTGASTGGRSDHNSNRNFRCIFSDEMR